MFEIFAESPLDPNWETRDELIRRAGGEPRFCGSGAGCLEHQWLKPTFEEAYYLVFRLNKINGVKAHLQEAITFEDEGGKKRRRYKR